jgi:hypothetical protein
MPPLLRMFRASTTSSSPTPCGSPRDADGSHRDPEWCDVSPDAAPASRVLKWLVVDRISGPNDHEGDRTRESRQVVVMPQNSEYRWDEVWTWSTPVRVHHLREGCRYAITLCDDDDVAGTRLMNMSYLDHFTSYTNNGRMMGGGDGLANFANIARIRLRSL